MLGRCRLDRCPPGRGIDNHDVGAHGRRVWVPRWIEQTQQKTGEQENIKEIVRDQIDQERKRGGGEE